MIARVFNLFSHDKENTLMRSMGNRGNTNIHLNCQNNSVIVLFMVCLYLHWMWLKA